jgi:hypothetical protein
MYIAESPMPWGISMRRPAAVVSCMIATTVAVAGLVASPATAGVARQAEDPPPAAPDRVADPDAVLDAGWRASTDRAVTTVGDPTGLHVLVADRAGAYQWRTVATLTEPMLEADQWIGQFCVNGAGSHAVVVYAPRAFTNRPALMEAGAFAAVVDLATGDVTKLEQRVTLAYYNPACGADGTAVLSRLEQSYQAGVPAKTWIATVDTTSATVQTEVRADGQLSSAVPVGGEIIAAKGDTLVTVGAAGETTIITHTGGAPLRLMPEGDGGLAFQVGRDDEVDLARLADDGSTQVVETVPLGAVKLRPGAGGEVYAMGQPSGRLSGGALPEHWRSTDAPPDSQPSTEGGLVVIRAGNGVAPAAGLTTAATTGVGEPRPVRIEAKLPGRAEQPVLGFAVRPAVGLPGAVPSPSLGGPAGADQGGEPESGAGTMAEDYSTVPWDPDRACAVPRNDPQVQVYQPSHEEVEWAVDLAVRGQLTITRPANWLNSGLPSYSPQDLFPSKPLADGGSVPAQIMLAVVAQESNLYQASWRIVDGLAGNPLTSAGFYGMPWDNPDPYLLNWADVDCGYGAAQVTTGMHSDDTGQTVNGVQMTYTKQKAVAQDYAVNIAAGLRILQDKWNQTYNAGLIANDGDPSKLENWWFAVWAYNSGFYPDQGSGPWGVGWSNNPASPMYPEDRAMFLTAALPHPDVDPPDAVGYDNARHPNHWSYPERVMGFAYHSLRRWDYQQEEYLSTYQPAFFDGDTTLGVQPHRLTFCNIVVNDCDPENETYEAGQYPGYPLTHCMRDDLMCWYHGSRVWVLNGCEGCGVERRRYIGGTPEPPRANPIYSAPCTRVGLPDDALIIDDIDSAEPLGRHGCARTWGDNGTVELEFASRAGPQGDPVYPSKVDFHQINGGFGGHFWMAHVWDPNVKPAMRVTATWTLDSVVDGPAAVWVHVPDHGARTHSAHYQIGHEFGLADIEVQQEWISNRWRRLGAFQFDDQPWVRLSNMNEQAGGTVSMAFDAVAFQPLPVACYGQWCDGLDPNFSSCDQPGADVGDEIYGSTWSDSPDSPVNLSLQLREGPICQGRWAAITVDGWCETLPPCPISWPRFEYKVERQRLMGSEWVTTDQQSTLINFGTTGTYWTWMVPSDTADDRHQACYRGNAEDKTDEQWPRDKLGSWECTAWYP